jgi:hypothetical protein
MAETDDNERGFARVQSIKERDRKKQIIFWKVSPQAKPKPPNQLI